MRKQKQPQVKLTKRSSMKNIQKLLDGKKTYLTAGLIFVLGGLSALGVVVPEWVWMMLSALGLGSLRSAVNKS